MDIVPVEKLSRMVSADTLRHNNVREIGTEWICHNTWNKLQLTELLLEQGFNEDEANLVGTQVISRAAYPASELKKQAGSKKTLRCASSPVMIWRNLQKINYTKVPCTYTM